jgi:hypothetical protein
MFLPAGKRGRRNSLYCPMPAIVLGAMLICASRAQSTELRLLFRDETGAPVRVSKAELLLVAWGTTDRIELKTNETSLLLLLDPEWLRSRWPDPFQEQEKVYLYLQAPGYVAMRSDSFLWLGAHGDPFGDMVESVKLSFPGGRRATLQPGDNALLEVIFRKPVPRYLRILDDDRNLISGVRVSSYMFWSRSNHCGVPSGADRLQRSLSDGEGRVQLPDGDFEYMLELEKDFYYPRAQGGSYHVTPDIPRLFLNLEAEETTIIMHRLELRPLEMRVTRNGEPVAGLMLCGMLAGCPCGACSGGVARGRSGPDPTSDREGNLLIPEFYSEEWERVYFLDKDGKILWEADPQKWPKTGTIHVELK